MRWSDFTAFLNFSLTFHYYVELFYLTNFELNRFFFRRVT